LPLLFPTPVSQVEEDVRLTPEAVYRASKFEDPVFLDGKNGGRLLALLETNALG